MQRRGFTLIELLVVIVIIGILVAIALPNFIKIKDKAKEAEVKQNCHAIQLALERYAVDVEGNIYPIILMGGDWTDSYVVWQSWVDAQGFDPANDILNPNRAAGWVPAARDVGDPLVMEAFLPSYPENPFIKAKTDTILPRIGHNAFNTGYWERIVAGRESNKMYEVFGPDWLITVQTIQGDFWVHHIFNNPPYDTASNFTKDPSVSGSGWDQPSGNLVLVGNFSYWPRCSDGGVAAFPLNSKQDPVGYTIAGYGSVRTKGQDVYNRNGNYVGRFRTEPCNTDCESGQGIYPDVDCICAGNGNANGSPNRDQNNGGSDTIIDGVVITLDSGVDKKTGRTNVGVTETDG